MGGLAFHTGDHPLCTPRMPRDVYHAVRDRCQERLRQYFTYVGTPIEAPEKRDYGDVDILVACPSCLLDPPGLIDSLTQILGAVQVRKGSTSSFAVPWPTDLPREEETTDITLSESQPEYFTQVDVTISESKSSWDWEMFHHAHGDLWNILGTTIRPFGLTANNHGLHLRIEEIERADRKKSLVFLTELPSQVLEFLGLNERLWWTQFETVEELFQYAAECRFFSAEDHGEDVEQDKREMKHNDRQRMAHRVIFRRWVEEFVPACHAKGSLFKTQISREQTKLEAFSRFAIEQEYNQRLSDWQRAKQTDEIWRKVITAGVPVDNVDPQLRASSLRALRTVVLEEDYRDGIVPSGPLKNQDGSLDVDAIMEFVNMNWRTIGEIRIARQRARAAEAIRAKKRKQSEQVGNSSHQRDIA